MIEIETLDEKEKTIRDFPIEWQIVLRATQSLVSKAKNGADIKISRNKYLVIYNTKKATLELIYYPNKKMLEVLWMKYKDNGEREPIFIKTYEKRIEEEEALELISVWYETILSHIKYKSNTSVIFQNFFNLYNMFKEKYETKQ